MKPEEMLCRVKSPQNNKKWLYGYYSAAKVTRDKIAHFMKVVDKDYNAIGAAVISDINTLCRTTTLKDKKGKTIFENDIVKAITLDTSEEAFAVVRYGKFKDVNADDEDIFIGFYLETEDYCATLYQCGGEVLKYIEVVGNIFDNPELI